MSAKNKKPNLPAKSAKKLPPAKKPKWVEDEEQAAKQTKPASNKVETKPASVKKVETKTADGPKGFHLDALVLKSDPDFKTRDNTIAAFFKAAFAKQTKVAVGVQDILDSGFTAPRSAVFKEDPLWFVRDHVSYFMQKGLLKQIG